MNVVVLVIDSVRTCSLGLGARGPATPFFDRLGRETISFRRAYATECWTLPTHLSMLTGLLPSEHEAHFQTMQYTKPTPTLAELLAARGYHTEVITRNPILDGSVPGATRGFRKNTQILSDASPLNPCALALALSKPRFRRQIKTSGFFHPFQRASRGFVRTFARATLPADRLVLRYTLEQMARFRKGNTPSFFFCNLYDVHAPYPPVPNGIFRPLWTRSGFVENLIMPFVLPRLGSHVYLRPNFQLSDLSRRLLLDHYHRAIELMDAKLAEFYSAARDAGLLDDAVLIVTSDHGEAFGEHGLYLHDASVWNTHLHVPLWICHPERTPTVVDDIVSTRDLFGLIKAAATDGDFSDTILDADYRRAHPIALAEHFHYPHAVDADPRYKQDLLAAIAGTRKVIVRREGVEHYDLHNDPDEAMPIHAPLSEFEVYCRRERLPGAAIAAAMDHLARWQGGSQSRHLAAVA